MIQAHWWLLASEGLAFTHIVHKPYRLYARPQRVRRRLALRFSLPLDGRGSALSSVAFSKENAPAVSAAPAGSIGSGNDRRPRLAGEPVPAGDGRVRAAPSPPDATGRTGKFRAPSCPSFANDRRAAKLVWPEHPRTGRRPLLRHSGVIPCSPAGICRAGFWFARRRGDAEDVARAAGAFHQSDGAFGTSDQEGKRLRRKPDSSAPPRENSSGCCAALNNPCSPSR